MSLEVSTRTQPHSYAQRVRRASQVIILAMCAFPCPGRYTAPALFLRLMRKLWV